MYKISQFLFNLVKPRSEIEDNRRREFILNILLLGTIILSVTALWGIIVELIRLKSEYQGSSLIFHSFVTSIFIILYLLSRYGYFRLVSYILILIYIIPVSFAAYQWGVDLPQILLTYALIIIIAGILISTRFAFFITLILVSWILLIGYFQIQGVIFPKPYWRQEVFGLDDIVVFSFTFFLISVISWLSNREIENSLKRARRSEKALQKERDILEVKVEERTKELKQIQREKAMQLYHFAEFGKIAGGLFHDLINPLTAISLNLETLKNIKKTEQINPRLDNALGEIQRIANLIYGVRRQIQKQDIKVMFYPSEQIALALHLFSFQIRKFNIQVEFIEKNKEIKIYGNPLKFYRVISSLVGNAIDSYQEKYKNIENNFPKEKILISLEKKESNILVLVQDWAMGISKENLEKVFQPFFTTKSYEKGIGLGLNICQEIIEQDFLGKIRVKSQKNKITTFEIEFPQKNKKHD